MFDVYVKFDGQTFAVEVEADWTVSRLKSELASCHRDGELKAFDIEVIFCGKTLCDDLKLQDCEVQETSTLFATRRKPPAEDQGAGGESFNRRETQDQEEGASSVDGYHSLVAHIVDLESQVDAEGREEDGHPGLDICSGAQKTPRIYVYCKTPCHSVQPGKLRVCCRTCKEGTFIVQRDPTCWDDVLIPFRISGRCQMKDCSGTTGEFFFKCGSHPTAEDDRVVALYLIKCNTRDVVCLTCGDTRDPVLIFPCPSGHTICLDCFATYCQVRLDERRFTADEQLGYTLPCPVGCAESLITETHHFRILGDEQYSRYQLFGAEECLIQDGGVLCPSPGCGAGLVPDSGSRRVECIQHAGMGCGLVFCRDCRNTYHQGDCSGVSVQPGADGGGGESYSVSQERAAAAQWEMNQSRETIRLTTKPCPRCKAPVEKSGGCMHMTCPRQQCQYEWCWMCSIQWNHHCMADHWFDVN